jgi:hypothetical protein
MPTTPTTPTTPQQQQQHPAAAEKQPQQIRHAGRTHVRGKIRRIWRPRYLELWDNGLVRYHELPMENNNNSNNSSNFISNGWSDIALPSEMDHELHHLHHNHLHNHHHHHPQDALPKYTLQIFHARILDVTTFRDMHVGLPRGAFGFVFRGQRLVHLEMQEYAQQQFQSALQSVHEHHGTNIQMLSSTASLSSLVIPSPTASSSSLGLASMSACQPSAGSSSAAAAAAAGASGVVDASGMVKEARDFLCAVSSLEEAQMWVVALQWAAANTKMEHVHPVHPVHAHQHFLPATGMEPWWRPETTSLSPLLLASAVHLQQQHPPASQASQNPHHYQRPSSLKSSTTPTLSELEDWEHATIGSSSTSPTTTTSAARAAADGTGDGEALTLSSFETIPPSRTIGKSARFLSTTTTATPATTTSTRIFSNDPTAPVSPFTSKKESTTRRSTASSAPSTGKMVVTKVTRLTTVRISTYTWEMAYQIHGLMLRGVQSSSQSSSSSSSSRAARQQQQVQVWSMLRTAQDFERLVTNLCKELGPTLLDRVPLGALRHLPRLQQHKNNSNIATKKEIWNVYSREEWIRSVAIVDGILRSLVSDASTVNATAMKVFLGLTPLTRNLQQKPTSSSSSQTTWCWLSDLVFCDANHYHDSQAILYRSIQPLPEQYYAAPDQYVKAWLMEHRSQQKKQQEQSSRSTGNSTGGSGGTSAKNPPPPLNSNTVMTSCDFYAATILQRPILWLGAGLSLCAGCVVILSPLAARSGAFFLFGQQQSAFPIVTSSSSSTATTMSHWLAWPTMPSFTIRLDCLVASWLGAAYIGMKHRSLFPFWSSRAESSSIFSNSKSSRQSVSSNKRSRRHPTTTTSSSSLRKSVDNRRTTNTVNGNSKLIVTTTSDTKVFAEGDDIATKATIGSVQPEDETSVAIEEEEESDAGSSNISPSDDDDEDDDDTSHVLSSPLPEYPANDGVSCWSKPPSTIFHVRSASYLQDRVKQPSGCEALKCRGVDLWMTDNPERHIARHPAVLGGKLGDEDTFLVNFLLPFGNFVTYFSIPPLHEFPEKLRSVWTKFLDGDQQYRDARLKLLPVVVEGPWIVKAAVGPGKSPALLGKVIPLQYFFRKADPNHSNKRGVYEVDVIITASTIAKGILSVVKSHTNSLSIAFAFIIEAAEEEELPETVLCSVQVHSLRLEDCPILPPYDDNTDENELFD